MGNKKNVQTINKSPGQTLDLFYMTPSTVKAKDIALLLKDRDQLRTELWEEMNILELEFIKGSTIDFEPLDMNFRDPSDAAFIKNRRIQTIFAVTLEKNDLPLVKELFGEIIDHYSGFLCADSEDFHPIHVGSAENLADRSKKV